MNTKNNTLVVCEYRITEYTSGNNVQHHIPIDLSLGQTILLITRGGPLSSLVIEDNGNKSKDANIEKEVNCNHEIINTLFKHFKIKVTPNKDVNEYSIKIKKKTKDGQVGAEPTTTTTVTIGEPPEQDTNGENSGGSESG
jgi:hypothetical protein